MSNPNPSPNTRFRPGQSGNPKGRPKLPPVSSRIFEMLLNGRLSDLEPKEDDTLIDVFVKLLLKLALEGEHRFVKILLDRVDGRATDWSKMDKLHQLIDQDLDARIPDGLPVSVATHGSALEIAHIPGSLDDPALDKGPSTSCACKSFTSIKEEMVAQNRNVFPANRKVDGTNDAIDGRIATPASRGQRGSSPTGEQTTIQPDPMGHAGAVRLQSSATSNGRSPLGDIRRGDAVGLADELNPKGSLTFPARLASLVHSPSRKQNRAERRRAQKLSKSLG
jgi:hypothetical protein